MSLFVEPQQQNSSQMFLEALRPQLMQGLQQMQQMKDMQQEQQRLKSGKEALGRLYGLQGNNFQDFMQLNPEAEKMFITGRNAQMKQGQDKQSLTLNEQLNQVKSRTKTQIDDLLLPHKQPNLFGGLSLDLTKIEAKTALEKARKLLKQSRRVAGDLYMQHNLPVPGDILGDIEIPGMEQTQPSEVTESITENTRGKTTVKEKVMFDSNNPKHKARSDALLKEFKGDKKKAVVALLKEFNV